MLQEKITKIQTLLVEQKQDFLLIGNFGHQISDDLLYWLLLEKLEYGFMLIPQSGKPTLFAIPFEAQQLKQKREEFLTIIPAATSVEKSIQELIPSTESTLAVRASALPYHISEKLKTIPQITLTSFTHEEHIMSVKLPKEISRMRQAAKLTNIIFTELLKGWHACYTEADAANLLLTLMAERGVEPSFPPIIASGINAANPHHHPEYKKINSGFCVIDFGIRFKGYCSDMTRTVYIGTPTAAEIDIYTTVLAAQEKTIKKIAPGIAIKELDVFCRNELGPDLATLFIHSLGHGLGAQVHEYPTVSKKSETMLNPHTVITIEPGVYLADQYGIRIEDDVLVTEQGYDVLTQSDKTLHLV